MSIEALGHVFLLTLPASEKWLLVCLANHADKWGDSIFPALETLEEESGMSRSTIKRAFKELLKLGAVERLAKSTPVSPAFYRIVGVPEPRTPAKSEPQCPNALRRAVIHEWGCRCEYCGRLGTKDLDPDEKPWHVDRIVPGKKGGIYTPDNVTLACRLCNHRKKANDAPPGTRSLTVKQREGTVQVEPSPVGGGTVQPEPPEGPNSQGGTGQVERSEGSVGTPNLLSDPISDPILESVQAGAAPRHSQFENPNDNVGVITKLAHEVLDLYEDSQERITLTDISESVKLRCATLDIAYDSTVVGKAIDSAAMQRARVGKPFVVPELRAVRIS